MKKILLLFTLFFTLFFPGLSQAQVPTAKPLPMDFYYAEVEKVREKDYMEHTFYEVNLMVDEGNGETRKIKIDITPDQVVFKKYQISPGDKLIVRCFEQAGEEYCDIVDSQRKTQLTWLVVGFILILLVVGRWKGLSSLVFLSVSVGVILFFIIPRILDGQNILHTTMIAVWCFILPSTFIAHGFSKKTFIAVASMFFSTILIWLISFVFIDWSRIFGTTSEELFHFITFSGVDIDLRGLLLAGILIGALGIMDDVCYAQVAGVYEINEANPKLSLKELYGRTMNIGRHHIISVTNTLFLAYASVSLPTIMLVYTYSIPWQIALQREMVATEIIRAVIGTAVVVVMIPITTFITSFYLKYLDKKLTKK